MRLPFVIGAALLIAVSGASAETPPMRFQTVAEGIHTLTSDAHANKAVIGEFDRFLVVIEFPQNDTLANAIIDEARARFPKKPIRYVLHSHHHLHSISGFDPFLRRTQAKLVTSPYNAAEVARLTRDTLALKQRLVVNDSVFTVKDRRNRLVAHVIPQSGYAVPTKEYNLVYFPRQELLISGCLFNKPLTYYEVVNARKPALKKIIADRRLAVRTLLPTNTCSANGFEDVCSVEMLDSTLVKGIKPDEFADALQGHSIEYLESRTDSLTDEMRNIPRSFDYMICGNTLKTLRKDYNRAMLVFKCLTKVYPKEADSYFFIGECYELKGYRLEAIAYYRRFLEITKDRDDIADVTQRIEKLKGP